MARVTEKWSERRFARGRNARRVFEVDNGPVTDADAQAAVVTAASINYGSSHPLDPSLTVPSGGISVETVVPGLFRVFYEYEANAVSGDTTALFTKKWQVLPTEIISEEVEADLTYAKNPVLNSAFMPDADPITRVVQYYRFRLRRYETGTDLLTKNLTFQNKWNNDAVILPRYGNATPKQLKIISIAQVDAQEQGGSTGVLVEYVIEARPTRTVKYNGGPDVEIHGWHRRRLDRGMMAFTGTGYGRIYSKHGIENLPITEPVLLDGRGWPLLADDYYVIQDDGSGNQVAVSPPGSVGAGPVGAVRESAPNGAPIASADAVFLNWDVTEGPIAFAGLNIAANL